MAWRQVEWRGKDTFFNAPFNRCLTIVARHPLPRHQPSTQDSRYIPTTLLETSFLRAGDHALQTCCASEGPLHRYLPKFGHAGRLDPPAFHLFLSLGSRFQVSGPQRTSITRGDLRSALPCRQQVVNQIAQQSQVPRVGQTRGPLYLPTPGSRESTCNVC